MIENKLTSGSKYFKDLENITLKQKKLFNLLGKDTLNSATNKIVKATLNNSNRFLYRIPLSHAIMTKLYMIFFK